MCNTTYWVFPQIYQIVFYSFDFHSGCGCCFRKYDLGIFDLAAFYWCQFEVAKNPQIYIYAYLNSFSVSVLEGTQLEKVQSCNANKNTNNPQQKSNLSSKTTAIKVECKTPKSEINGKMITWVIDVCSESMKVCSFTKFLLDKVFHYSILQFYWL